VTGPVIFDADSDFIRKSFEGVIDSVTITRFLSEKPIMVIVDAFDYRRPGPEFEFFCTF
jgi:hypothetical protein